MVGYITERDLQSNTGLTPNALRKVRADLVEHEDWDVIGREVVFSKNGLDKALRLLGLEDEVTASEFATPAAPQAPALEEKPLETYEPGEVAVPILSEKPPAIETAVLTAVQARCRNTKLILAVKKNAASDGIQKVRVRSNKNFRAGMDLPCRKVGDDIWELTVPPPRFRGKW